MVENMGQDAAVDVISWRARVKDVAAGQYNTVCIVCQSHDPHKYIFPQASSHTICTRCVINTKDVTPAKITSLHRCNDRVHTCSVTSGTATLRIRVANVHWDGH